MAGRGRFPRWWLGPLPASLCAAIAACGGGDEPSPEERRVAKTRWVQRVDAACRKANEAIAERGWPADLVDLDRLVVRGIEDARGAIRSIAAERIPAGAGPHPEAFVGELKALEPQLAALSEASEDLEPEALVKAAEDLKPRLASLEKRAERAGLSDCLSHDERFFLPDAVRAPVFAEQLAKLDRLLLSRIESIDFAAASSPGEFARAFERYSEVIDTAVKGIDTLEPPQWAADQTSAYQVALRELQSVTQTFAALLEQDRGKPLASLDRAQYARLQRELNRAAHAELKARRRMLKAVGAAPTTRPPGDDGGGEIDPEGEQQS